MKAIKVIDKNPVLVDVPEPKGEGVKVKVVSSAICGSDTHMMALDAFGSSASLRQSTQMIKPMGRIGLVGAFWETVGLEQEFCGKEVELIPSCGYNCKSPNRNFEEAGTILHEHPDISGALITHRFPLDGVAEAFAAAADRAAGAIKVVFDIA